MLREFIAASRWVDAVVASGYNADSSRGFCILCSYANCLAALIEEVALGPAHVAGLSWGGTVVLELFIARQFELAIPVTELVLIPHCGHVSNLEQPVRVNEALRGFCRAHSIPASSSPSSIRR